MVFFAWKKVYQLLSGVEQKVIHCEINISFSDFLQYPWRIHVWYIYIHVNVGKYTSPTYLMEFTNSKHSPLFTSPTNLNQSHQSTAIYVKFSIVATPGMPTPTLPTQRIPIPTGGGLPWEGIDLGQDKLALQRLREASEVAKVELSSKAGPRKRRDESLGLGSVGWGGIIKWAMKTGAKRLFLLRDQKNTQLY